MLLCSIISLFFCFCPPHPSPHPTRTPHWWHMGAELSWQTHHPLLSGPLESPTTPGPPSEHRRAGHSAGIWTGWWEHLGKKRKRNRKGRAVASSLSPLLHSFLEERLLANLRQQLWILRHVLFGRCDYFHRKNIFIDKTLSVVRGCFVRCFVWFARPWRELCLPYDLWKTHNSKNDSFVSEGNNACLFGEAIIGNIFKKKKKKKEKQERLTTGCFQSQLRNDDFWHILRIFFCWFLFHFMINYDRTGERKLFVQDVFLLQPSEIVCERNLNQRTWHKWQNSRLFVTSVVNDSMHKCVSFPPELVLASVKSKLDVSLCLNFTFVCCHNASLMLWLGLHTISHSHRRILSDLL